MSLRLERVSVIDQVAAAMRQGIERGEWQGWLPGERRLCADLHVGRNTLRAALQCLSHEGLIQIVPGQGTRIVDEAPVAPPHREMSIGLLSPGPMELLFPRQILWIDDLRGQLAEKGCLLKMLHGQQYFRSNPASALHRLVEQEKCGCWILVFSSKSAQQWFEANAVPCVIAGSCHQGVGLPFVDIDYRALCRHAATLLIRLGHSTIVFFTNPPELAGDIHSETGFMEGIKGYSKAAEVDGGIVHHGPTVERIVHTVHRLMERPNPPTALLVHNAFLYLTVFSTLTQMGLQIPRDISLVCREAESFLPYIEPRPASYGQNPHQFASKLVRITDKLLSQTALGTSSAQLIPKFVKGASIAPPREATAVPK